MLLLGGEMVMRRYHHLVEGALQPEEIDKLQAIFDVIIAQPLFNFNEFSREAFAADLIKLYRRGIVDRDRLHNLANLTAIAHFSRELPEEKRKALQLLYSAQKDFGDEQ